MATQPQLKGTTMSVPRLPTMTGMFRVGADPELRFTPSGKAVAGVSLIQTERKKEGDEWVDGDSTGWINASCWDADAEALAEHVRKGMVVLVTGSFFTRVYEKRDGTTGVSMELKWCQVAPIPATDRAQRTREPQANDPWASAPATEKKMSPTEAWGVPTNDEPPW